MQSPQFDTADSSPKPSQFSRCSTLTLLVAILAVASIVSALTAMRFAIHGREVEVPSLMGKSKDEAEQLLKGLDLKLKVSSSQFSADVVEGKVLAQVPSNGTRIRA